MCREYATVLSDLQKYDSNVMHKTKSYHWIDLWLMNSFPTNRPNLTGAPSRLWWIESECLTSVRFGPRSFQLGSREVKWGDSLEEESCWLAIFKAPDRVRGHMHGWGGYSRWWQTRGKTLNWLRGAQSTRLLYLTGDCARSRTTTNSQVGINI